MADAEDSLNRLASLRGHIRCVAHAAHDVFISILQADFRVLKEGQGRQNVGRLAPRDGCSREEGGRRLSIPVKGTLCAPFLL